MSNRRYAPNWGCPEQIIDAYWCGLEAGTSSDPLFIFSPLHQMSKCLTVLEPININNSVSLNDICADNMQIKWHFLEVVYTAKRSAEKVPF